MKGVRVVQMGFYLIVWPDGKKNRFHMYDLKCKGAGINLDAVNQRQSIPAILNLSIDGIVDTKMASLISLEVFRYSNEEKFYLAMLFPDEIIVKKILFMRTLSEGEESGGWKPPLFLIGIGFALLYQFFFRPKNSGSSLSKKTKHGLINKEINNMYKLGKRLNR